MHASIERRRDERSDEMRSRRLEQQQFGDIVVQRRLPVDDRADALAEERAARLAALLNSNALIDEPSGERGVQSRLSRALAALEHDEAPV